MRSPTRRASGAETLNFAALIRDGAEAMAGADQALDRLTVANARFEIDNEATHSVVTYKDFNLVFDRSSEEARAQLSATGPAGRWSAEARASVSGAPTLALEARDMSLSDLEAFDKRPPPLFAEGPISFKFDARLAEDQSIQSLTGRFDVGAGQVRLNNPDALPFLVDEASGKMVWEEADKRLRVDDLVVLAGDTHVNAGGWVSPPREPAGSWAMRFESKDSRFASERAGAQAVSLTSLVADATFSPSQSRFTLDNFIVRGPTVDVDLKADVAPDGPGVSLKLDMTVNPSVTPDVIRLWPQFINPDVRDWCAQNLHGGKIQGVMNANWSAADLDAMDHKRAVARDSVHGSFTSRDVGVDLLPGLPMMVSSEASGRFTGRDFSLTANRAAMTLTPTRRVDADRITFSIPDTSPKPIIDGEADVACGRDSRRDRRSRQSGAAAR